MPLYNPQKLNHIATLAETIKKRKDTASKNENSYTATLIAKGRDHCAQKFGEEAIETLIAVLNGDKQKIQAESADLLYHFLVLLEVSDIALDDIMDVLKQRQNISGLDEKKSRKL